VLVMPSKKLSCPQSVFVCVQRPLVVKFHIKERIS
jgi:hypothetical protein